MGFDNWGFRDKVVMIWALSIATIALVFVGVSLGNLTSDNSSTVASWVQAIVSILAIVATWYIASLNDRKRIDSENRVAALEASTMYVELMSLRDTLANVNSRLVVIGRKPDEIFPQNTFSLISEILAINTRPLSEQKDLVPAGIKYLSQYSKILRSISKLKNLASNFSYEIHRDYDFALFIFIDEMPGLIDSIALECRDASEMLRSFAEAQGMEFR